MTITVVPAATTGGNYGCRRNPGAHDPACPPGSRRHHGVDIPAPEGSPVFSPVSGIVQRAWPNGALSRYGNLLLIWEPTARVTLVFAHLMEMPARADGTPLRQGDAVTAGEQVAKVGYTGACGSGSRVSAHGVRCTPCGPGGRMLCGGASSAHLHLEVRPGRVNRPNPRGDSINPTLFAREHGFNLYRGGPSSSLAGVGLAPTSDPYAYTADKYYWDPTGFEPGDDEPAPLSTVAKAAITVGVAGVVAALVVAIARA